MPRKRTTVNTDDEEKLHRFTDPVKRQKKVNQRQIRKKEKQQKICNRHKKYANQFYNLALNKETYEHLLTLVVQPFIVSKNEVLTKLETQTAPVFEEPPSIDHSNPMAVIGNFIKCAEVCQQWLNLQLSSIGWKTNATNYHPLAVSHSTTELTKATLECLRMACKQMILVLDYKAPEKESGPFLK